MFILVDSNPCLPCLSMGIHAEHEMTLKEEVFSRLASF